MKALLHLFLAFSAFCCSAPFTQTTENITIENDFISVEISPVGAELQSIHVKRTGEELLWQGDPAYWSARAPVMFPVNVRMKDDSFTYKGKKYEIPRMGLAVNFPFSLLPMPESGTAVLEMKSGEETLPFYPFHFRLEITYKLEQNKLINQFLIENTGDETIYFALGGHPGFNCPLDIKPDRNDYQYTFSEILSISHHKISNGLVQPVQLSLLENENRLRLGSKRIPSDSSGMFVTNMPSRIIGIGPSDEPPKVSLDLGDFPNVNLWSPPGMPFACIEPMVSHHDLADSPSAIEEKSHLIALPAGESRLYRFIIIAH